MSSVIEKNIEGKFLQESQEKAILANDKNICVNAGAGSGKTFTILAKLIHLLDQKLAKPEEIIIVAYNNRVANELRDRILNLSESFPNLEQELKRISISIGSICLNCNKKIDSALHYCESTNEYIERKVHTFHSYCYDQIKKRETKKLASFLEPKENKLLELRKAKFFENIVEKIGNKDEKFFKIINDFFLSYLQRYKNIFKDIKSMDEYRRLVKPRHVCLKIIEVDDEEIHLEVKSIEELEIANFLYLRGIEFKYEDPYTGEMPEEWRSSDNNREYKPDFHLIKKNEKGEIEYDLYCEHFALDNKLEPPNYFSDVEKYKNDYKIKKKLLGDKLISTYSYQKLEGTLFENLIKELRKKGINIPDENVITDEEALSKFREAGYFNAFANLVSNFLTNFKLRESKIKELKAKVEKNWFKKLFEKFESKRERAFVKIFETIYKAYQQQLLEEGRVDYEDMLIEGKKYIENQNIKYLIVDEFQDISPLRARVLQQIQINNKNIQLFCVGDDWQSIYRFSGGDIGIIVNNYDSYFGKRTMVDLGLTYRFNNRLSELTSSFILKNFDGQLNKKIKGREDYDEIPLSIFTQVTQDNKFKVNFSVKIHLMEKLDNLFSKDGSSIKKILFLARYNDYVYRNGYEDLKKYIYNIFKNKKKIIKFSTIHSAKGDEADYVFLINVHDSSLGFPSTIENDPILNLVIDDFDSFEHEEERRLFYVALTRTKKQVFLYGDEDSYFFKQIFEDENNKNNHHYTVSRMPDAKKPECVIVITKGNKEIDLKPDDEIVKINDRQNPKKRDLLKALRESNGKEISFHVKNENGIEVKKIKPINKNEGKKIKKQYDLGIKYFEREIHPFIDKLKKKYSLIK